MQVKVDIYVEVAVHSKAGDDGEVVVHKDGGSGRGDIGNRGTAASPTHELVAVLGFGQEMDHFTFVKGECAFSRYGDRSPGGAGDSEAILLDKVGGDGLITSHDDRG